MKVILWEEADGKTFLKETAATVGVFDGVHLGHRALLKTVVDSPYEPVAVTFKSHPLSVLAPQKAPRLLITLEEKLAIFEKIGLEAVVLIDFSKSISIMEGAQFLRLLRERSRLAFMAAGASFKCGRGGGVDAAEAARLNAEAGVRTEIVPPVLYKGLPVSSSRIRQALVEGNIEDAKEMLGSGRLPAWFDCAE